MILLFEIKGTLSGRQFQVNTYHMNIRAVATTNAGEITVPLSTYNIFLLRNHITASNLGLLLQKEQSVKWGEGPSGKQAVGKTMEHGKLCLHIFNYK